MTIQSGSGESGPRMPFWKKILIAFAAAAGLFTFIAVLIAGLQLAHDFSASRRQDRANSTVVALLNQQLTVQEDISTLQARAFSETNSIEATAIAQHVQNLSATEAYIEQQIHASLGTLTQAAPPILATAGPSPTIAPSLTPSLPPSPPTPTSTAPPTPIPNTPPGSVLSPGDSWYQDGMEIEIDSPSFLQACRSDSIFGFEITIVNRTGADLVVSISGLDFSITDDMGRSYTDVWWNMGRATSSCYCCNVSDLQIRAMQAAERTDLAFRVYGSLDQAVSYFTIHLERAGRVQNAQWRIAVPR